MVVEQKVLKSLEYFVGLNDKELEEVTLYLTEKNIDPDTTFLFEKDWSEHLYFLIKGMVKVSMSFPNGREQILHIAIPFEALNVVSTFDGGTNQANMTAITDTTIYTIRKNDLKLLLSKYPIISINIMRCLASRIRHESNLVSALSSGQVLNRLAMLLMGQYAGELAGISTKLTKEDMAGLIGTSREVIHRSLKVMEKSGAIKLYRRQIEILNKKKLLELSKGNAYN